MSSTAKRLFSPEHLFETVDRCHTTGYLIERQLEPEAASTGRSLPATYWSRCSQLPPTSASPSSSSATPTSDLVEPTPASS